MKQNAGNEEFVCGGGFEWNAGCGGAASSATPAVARQYRHFSLPALPPCPRHQPSTGDGQQELRLQGLVKRSCIRRTPRPDTTGGGSLSNARAAESAVLLFATGGRGTPSGRIMHTPARARQRDEEEKELGIRFEKNSNVCFVDFPGTVAIRPCIVEIV